MQFVRRRGVVVRVPAARVRFPAGLEILIFILGLAVRILYCPVLSLAVALTLC